MVYLILNGQLNWCEAMNHAKILFILSLTVVFGLAGVFGGYLGSRITEKRVEREFEDLFYRSIAAEMALRTAILRNIRNGETDKALRSMEALLDGNLITLSYYGDLPAERQRKEVFEALKRAKTYRTEYPSTASIDNVVKSINRALELADTEAGKNKPK